MTVKACIFFVLLAEACLAAVLPLDEDRPFLAGSGVSIEWPSGGAAFLLSSGPLMRVNARGVFTEPVHSRLRSDLASAGWARVACNLSAFSLCSASAGEFFPMSAPVYGEAELPYAWRGLRCSNSGGKTITGAGRYDVSACDVLDEGLDVVFSSQEAWFRVTSLPTWQYAVLLALATFLVRGLSVNLQRDRRPESQGWLVLACGACALLVASGGDHVYVTESDQLFFWCTLVYCAVYCVYHVYQLYTDPLPRPIYNLIAGTLQLVAARLYTGSESPYNPAVLFIIGARAQQKLRSAEWSQVGTSLVDAVYLSLMCELAFLPDARFLVALFFASYLYARGVVW